MNEEAFVSEYEVLSQYPELKELKVQIQDIKKMYSDIQQTTRSPIPTKGEQGLHLMNQIKELQIMKEAVQFQMNQITLRGVKSKKR